MALPSACAAGKIAAKTTVKMTNMANKFRIRQSFSSSMPRGHAAENPEPTGVAFIPDGSAEFWRNTAHTLNL